MGLTFDEVDFKKRMVMPKHEGSTKHSYISFYNGETEKAFETIDLDGDRLFKIVIDNSVKSGKLQVSKLV